MNMEGKRVVITGASSGIGEALAKRIAERPVKLALLARKADKLDLIKKKLYKKDIITHKCDVTDINSVKTAFDFVNKEFGGIDLAILNAGFSEPGAIERFNVKIAEQIINTNFIGLVYCFNELIGDFIKRKSGIIVGVSSLADNRGYSGSGFYCASKAAATLFLESMRIELARYDVKVLTVKPGFVKTPMTDKNNFRMPFLMESDKAAEIILKGIIKNKKVIQFPAPTVLGSKLIGVLPVWLYDYLAKMKKL